MAVSCSVPDFYPLMHWGPNISSAELFNSYSWSWRNHRFPWRNNCFHWKSPHADQLPDVIKEQKNFKYVQLKFTLYSAKALENTNTSISDFSLNTVQLGKKGISSSFFTPQTSFTKVWRRTYVSYSLFEKNPHLATTSNNFTWLQLFRELLATFRQTFEFC